MEIRGNNIDRSISMLLRIITASKIVIRNDIIEKQTSVIVYSYISFFNKNYHIVCDICEDRLFTPLCRVMRNI